MGPTASRPTISWDQVRKKPFTTDCGKVESTIAPILDTGNKSGFPRILIDIHESLEVGAHVFKNSRKETLSPYMAGQTEMPIEPHGKNSEEPIA